MKAFWLRYRGTRFPVRRGEYLLGRSPYCSIVVSNPLASRRHCALRLGGEGLTVVDLESANGTRVNGDRIQGERPVDGGDELRIGSEVLTVEVQDGTEPREPRRTSRHHSVPPLTPADAFTERPSAEPSVEDDSSTITHANTLELLEALVVTAGHNENPQEVAPIIQRTVERLLQQTGGKLSPQDADRVRAIVSSAACQCSGEGLASWRSGVLNRIAPSSP